MLILRFFSPACKPICWRILPLAIGILFLCSCTFRSLLYDVEVAPATISPNADGISDVALIRYTVGRPADVSVYFIDTTGRQHIFRDRRRRSPGRYEVQWGATVAEQEMLSGEKMLVESHVLSDGAYTWVVEATDDHGRLQRVEGQITIQDADTRLPEVREFRVAPSLLRPNEDGLSDDRVTISYELEKENTQILLYMIDANKREERIPVILRNTKVETGTTGSHEFIYDGGVRDQNGRYLNTEPPPDGEYDLYLVASDEVGNRIIMSTTLIIEAGGRPEAEIAGNSIDWDGEMNRNVVVPVGESFCFTTVVVNIGTAPIRTSGPWPGQSYDLTQKYHDLAVSYDRPSWDYELGVMRFGINYDGAQTDFPFRWAIGRPEDLDLRMIDGRPEYFLLPEHRGLVTGCIHFDTAPPTGTERWWGGLVHQGVQIEANNIDPINVQVIPP